MKLSELQSDPNYKLSRADPEQVKIDLINEIRSINHNGKIPELPGGFHHEEFAHFLSMSGELYSYECPGSGGYIKFDGDDFVAIWTEWIV